MFKTYFLDVLTKHYVDFSGKATRKQFWLFALFQAIIMFVIFLLSTMDNAVGTLFAIIYVLLAFAFFLPGLAIQIRRLHDIGRSGWWWFICLVPLLGSIVLLVFFLLPSKK